MPKEKEKPKERHDIRVINVPEKLYEAIKKNAKSKRISQGNEIINFLETNKYK